MPSAPSAPPPAPRPALDARAAADAGSNEPTGRRAAPRAEELAGDVTQTTSPFSAPDSLVAACQRELELAGDDRIRAARLHYELGAARADDPEAALRHYQRVLELMPDHLPALRAARKLSLARGDAREAAKLFDVELRLAPDAAGKAQLLFAKGRAIEDLAGDHEAARRCYRRAVELDPDHPSYLEALAHGERRAEAWESLCETRGGQANAVRDDARLRAVLLSERARLLETRLGRPREAIDIYMRALETDADLGAARESLKILLHEQGRWRELVDVLERELAQTADPEEQARALFQTGRIWAERLGAREPAIAALARAMALAPSDRLLLELLEQLYDLEGDERNVAVVLAHQVEATPAPRERIGLLHRIGQVYERALGDDESARGWYEAALRIDPCYLPALNALDDLYERARDWQSLVVAYMAAAEASTDALRRAKAHARIAQAFEMHVGRPEEAIRHHAMALALAPELEGSFKALERLYLQTGRHRELVELCERGLERAGDEVVAVAHLFKIGGLYEGDLDEPAQACHAYRRILERRPNDLGALHALGRAAERAGRWSEAIEALEREAALVGDRERPRLLALLQRAGEIAERGLGDRDAAIDRFQRALALDAHYAPALDALARIYQHAGRHQDLLEIYQRELESLPRGPQQVDLLHKMGELSERELAREEQAIGWYRRAVSLDPSHVPSLRALGALLRKRRDFKGLAGVLQSEIIGSATPSGRAAAAHRLGEIYEVHLAELDRATAAYEQALELAPDHVPTRAALARVRAQTKAFEALARSLTEEAERAEQAGRPRAAVDALVRAGEIRCERLGQREAAIAAYERARGLEPENLPALRALETLYRGAGAWPAVAETLAAQVQAVRDWRARVALLEELARLQERQGADESELRRTYGSILMLEAGNAIALEGLERIARASNNSGLVADVESRWARGERHPTLVAAHYVAAGGALEASSPAAALENYRKALEHDAESLGAMRGLRRTAEAVGDARAFVEACEREASFSRDDQGAALLLARSAEVLRERLGDAESARALGERALERSADQAVAASLVSRLLREAADVERLATVLGRAAAAASDPARKAALWREVARLQADDLGDLAAATATMQRLLAAQPADVETWRLVAELRGRNKQWAEAADALRRAEHLEPTDEQRVAIALELGRLYAHRLGDAAAAIGALELVVRLEPGHREAHTLLAELHEQRGDLGPARASAERLLALADSLAARAAALTRLGRLEQRADRALESAQALREAVAIEGPGGEATRVYKQLLGDEEPWERYVEVLREHLRRIGAREVEDADPAASYLEMARIQREVLLRDDEALATLRSGMSACDPDGQLRLHLELGSRLASAGRIEEALVEHQRMVAQDPARAAAWRAMGRLLCDAGRKLESAVAFAPLVVLGEATDVEQGLARQRRGPVGWAQPGAFDAAALEALSAAEPREEALMLALLAALYEALGELYPLDLASYGASPRDRIAERSEHPLRRECDRIATAFALPAYELYLHRAEITDVVAELGDPVTIMVRETVLGLPEAQRVFVLASAFAAVARGVHPVLTLGWREVGRVVRATLRSAVVGFGRDRVPPDAELEEVGRRLGKAMSRRNRKAAETAALTIIGEPSADFDRWAPTVALSSARAAALLTGDLGAAVDVLRAGAGSSLAGVQLVRSSAAVADLLRFWPSDVAMRLRRAAGLL